MQFANCVPVILCGGIGSRLWPLSRTDYPKSFITIDGHNTLFQATLLRNTQLGSAPVIVCGEAHRFTVADQLAELKVAPAEILLEPAPKDTAAAIAFAALRLVNENNDPVMLISPSDHQIAKSQPYRQALVKACDLANKNYLVTLGCQPDAPLTCYGYIQAGEPIAKLGLAVARFTEKPAKSIAKAYLEAGNFFWNSGIFVFKASAYLKALHQYAPAIYDACLTAVNSAKKEGVFVRPDKRAWQTCPKISVDYAVMEQAKNLAVVPLKAGWSDIGSWDVLAQQQEKNTEANVLQGDVLTSDVSGSFIQSNHRLVTAIGLNNHVVIETRDAILVADKKHCQQVKTLVDKMTQQGRQEIQSPSCVHRPWGTYETVEQGPGFLIKRITVKPGAKLSLQRHYKRSEHWVVVRGIAFVNCADKTFELKVNESTFIPIGMKHRLSNQTNEPLEIVEVQVGSYLGEDDIERLEDCYGRTHNQVHA